MILMLSVYFMSKDLQIMSLNIDDLNITRFTFQELVVITVIIIPFII